MQSKTPNGRLPKISPDNNRGSIRIRFRLAGHDYCITGFGRYDDPLCLANAEKVCQTIKMDILTGNFDVGLQKYRPKAEIPQNVISLSSEEKTLKDVWEAYKIAKSATTEQTTQISDWKLVDRILGKVPSLLSPENSYKLIPELLLEYAPGSLVNVCSWLIAASNFSTEKGLISKSYWSDLKSYLPEMTPSQRSKQAFTEEEVDAIFKAFQEDTYCSKYSAFKDSYYVDFIKFLLLVGCRPSEAIALRWKHISNNKVHVKQARVYGINKGTKNKNHKREFPVNSQLRLLLNERCPETARNPEFLIFSAPKGGYISLPNFTRRYWKRIVDNLVAEGKVEIYLPLYNLRHTALSFYARKGVDMASLAKLMGTSEQMLQDHYLGADRSIQLPEI